MATWYEKNREKVIKLSKEWQVHNQGRYQELQRKWREANSWGEALKKRTKQLDYKLKVVEMYGGKCIGCGINDYRVLQIDHIQEDGNQERRVNLTRKLALSPVNRARYQLLCANCNMLKQWWRGVHRNSAIDLEELEL